MSTSKLAFQHLTESHPSVRSSIIIDTDATDDHARRTADLRTGKRMKRVSVLLLATLVLVAPYTSADDLKKPMSFSELIVGLVDHVPGSSAGVESFLNAPSGARMSRFGWVHDSIDYTTRDGALLHIKLDSDRENKQAPDIVLVTAVVDAKECLDSLSLRDELTRTQHVTWKSLAPWGGWTGTLKERLLSVSLREGRCVASATVGNTYGPRPISTIHRGIVPTDPHPLPPGH